MQIPGSKRFKIIYILRALLLFSVVCTSEFIVACEWTISPETLLTPVQYANLKKRYQALPTQDSVTELLSMINRAQAFNELMVHYESGRCIFSGIKAATIKNIDVELITKTHKSELLNKLHHYLGQPDSQVVRAQIEAAIRSYLQTRGFYKINIVLQESFAGDGSEAGYHYRIDEGYPCYVNKVTTDFRIPFPLSFGVGVGDMCDEQLISDAMDTFTNQIMQQGYNDPRLLGAALKYDASTNTAILQLKGTLGKKVHYKIVTNKGSLLGKDMPDLDKTIIDPDVMRAEIIRFYRELGYDDVVIDNMTTQENADDDITYVFSVALGTRYFMTQVQIEGAKQFTREECLKTLQLDNVLAVNSPPLNIEYLRRGIDALTEAYHRKGYWDAQVHFPRITKNQATGETTLVYVIKEDKQRIFQKLEVQGNSAISAQEIMGFFTEKTGDPLVWQDLADFDRTLRLTYLKQGYIHTKVNVKFRESNLPKEILVDVLVGITENARVRIGDINIIGLVDTAPIVVRRELRFKTGEWYDPEAVEKTRKALFGLGLFSSVDIVPVDSESFSDDSDSMSYNIILRETKPGSITFGPGYSFEDGGRYDIEYAYRNIGGLGRQFFAKGTLSEQRRQSYIGAPKTLIGRTLGVGYVEPYIMDLPVNGTIKLNHQAEAGQYWQISRAGEVSLSHTLRHYLPDSVFTGFYGLKLTQIDALKALTVNLIDTGDVRTGTMGARFNSDQRNSITWPTKGYMFGAELSAARYFLGGDLQYDKWMLNHSVYYGITPNLVVAAGYNLAAFNNVKRKGEQDDILPTSERLFSGGADTNRGFALNELGPSVTQYNADTGKFDDIVLGGSRRGYYKLELRYLIKPDFVAVTLFMDASNSFFTAGEQQLFERTFASTASSPGQQTRMYNNSGYDFESVIIDPALLWEKNYVSSGVALNLLTPIGAVNVSYGVPVKHYPESRCNANVCKPRGHTIRNVLTDGVFNVNIGATF